MALEIITKVTYFFHACIVYDFFFPLDGDVEDVEVSPGERKATCLLTVRLVQVRRWLGSDVYHCMLNQGVKDIALGLRCLDKDLKNF